VTDHAVLGHHQDRHHSHLGKIREELVHLHCEQAVLGHRLQVSVEAVDHHDASAFLLDRAAHVPREFAGAHLGRIDALHDRPPRLHLGGDIHAEGPSTRKERAQPLVECVDGDAPALLRRSHRVMQR